MGFGLSNSKLIQKENEKANGTRKPCPNSEITVLRLGQEIDVERTVYLYQSEAQKLDLDLDLKGEILGIVRIYILDGKNLMVKDPILGKFIHHQNSLFFSMNYLLNNLFLRRK